MFSLIRNVRWSAKHTSVSHLRVVYTGPLGFLPKVQKQSSGVEVILDVV